MKRRIIRPVILVVLVVLLGYYGLDQYTVPLKASRATAQEMAALPTDDAHGKALVARHCGSCHLAPDPASLPKAIWQEKVLPLMGVYMGLPSAVPVDPLYGKSNTERTIFKEKHIIPDHPLISQTEWDEITRYIIRHAPDALADEGRMGRSQPLTQFTRTDFPLGDKRSLVTSIRYDPQTNRLWIGDLYKNVVQWQWQKGIVAMGVTDTPVVDFTFYRGQTYFTEVGKILPFEVPYGSFVNASGQADKPILPNLHRPVSSWVGDLDGDGRTELIVCNFGNHTGSLSLYQQTADSDRYQERVLLDAPGAARVFVQDMNKDGKPDIIALFAQADECVYVFYQHDKLQFSARRVLHFPPQYGTTDLALVDYNHDGRMDIVTVNGDNADYSQVLKPYHGLRLHCQQPDGLFTEAFVYPIYGATKVLADDFDQDGDVDFAVTAFYPDYGTLLHESFVYLENTHSTRYQFKAYSPKSGLPVKSFCLEKGDVDQDGDLDIILGHFAQSPVKVPDAIDRHWKAAPYGLTIFENQRLHSH